MIVVAGTGMINLEHEAAALAVMKTMQDATATETGCISYYFYQNPWNKAQVFIFEEWESDEALQAHFQTAHMATFREEVSKYVTSPLEVKRYVVDDVTDL